VGQLASAKAGVTDNNMKKSARRRNSQVIFELR
jgi:hypothetical protein